MLNDVARDDRLSGAAGAGGNSVVRSAGALKDLPGKQSLQVRLIPRNKVKRVQRMMFE